MHEFSVVAIGFQVSRRVVSSALAETLLQGLVPGWRKAEALAEESQQQAGSRTGFAFQAQGIDAGGLGGGQAVVAEQRLQFAAQQVLAAQPGWQVGDAEAASAASTIASALLVASRARFGRRCWSLPSCWKRQA